MTNPHEQLGMVQGSLGPALAGNGTAADYFALLKPRVMSLVVFTALAGLLAAPGHIHPWMAFMTLFAISLGAGAAGCLNMWFDADIDGLMKRTASRPLPQGRVLPGEALGFGLTLAMGSVLLLGLVMNWLAAVLLAFTILFYVVVYTMWLKRLTPQNIVIGGAAGALPPVIAWSAVTGTVDLPALSLFLVIFLWTPPHFWALALCIQDDYRMVKIPMLPIVKGEAETFRQIEAYTVALVALTLVMPFVAAGGLVLGVISLVLGGIFVAKAVRARRAGSVVAARGVFAYSIIYLFVIFLGMIADAIWRIPVVS